MTFGDRFRVDKKVALITGAGRGIGRDIALAFANMGADLFLCGRNPEHLAAVAGEAQALGVRAEAHAVDVSIPSAAQQAVDVAMTKMGRIDILINNAGSGDMLPACDVTEADWDRIMGLNLKGLFFLTQQVGTHMIAARNGRIINISSVAGLIGKPNATVYASSKAAVNALTKNLAVEWGPSGITVNAIAPGFIRTPLTEAFLSDPANVKPILARTPLGRFPEPDDVACAALFLASEAGRNITGQLIVVDGGRTAS